MVMPKSNFCIADLRLLGGERLYGEITLNSASNLENL